MSNAPSTLDGEQFPDLPDDSAVDLPASPADALGSIAAPFEFVGFWSAVALPLAYVPVLSGAVPSGRSTLAVLVAVHALALLAGHDYRRD
ncbi:hypothetical protein [Halorussus marinus]|uniref:hypothetical protein n=1 Tax=Halorussus marinus TaxID=2505976 RepID=UPI001B2FE69B|nr:hypothetical protein [Halorussus marinus]